MRHRSIFVSIFIIFTIVLTGCNSNERTNDNFIIWSEKMDDTELRESLIKRLENAKIEYKIDDDNNVLIREKDMNTATTCCS